MLLARLFYLGRPLSTGVKHQGEAVRLGSRAAGARLPAHGSHSHGRATKSFSASLSFQKIGLIKRATPTKIS